MAPMCKISLCMFLIIALCACEAYSRKAIDEETARERHKQWMARHRKVYHNANEKEARFKIFKVNVELIESHNAAAHKPYKLSVNEFADQTNEEFKAFRLGYKRPKGQRSVLESTFRYGNVSDVPNSVDWRSLGAVTPVKNQGQCGSCWTFSTVAAVEGITKIATGNLISLSEQEILDCDRTIYTQGCSGGFMEHAFEFIVSNKGLTTEANYPYIGFQGLCNIFKVSPQAATIRGYESVPRSEDALMRAAMHQPISVALDAAGSHFQFYAGGVFTAEDCGTELNHAVTVVGYGTAADGNKYWLVKNSWGAGWGEQGYIRIHKDVGDMRGLCGIAMEASFPIV